MPIISVVIPYYQRESGILSRALRSIRDQELPEGWLVEVIVIDDGSPLAASEEIVGIEFGPKFSLRVLVQPNGGVAAARNRGLNEVSREANLIAYLDSDDVWPKLHLARGIQAYNLGYDFIFTDNMRLSHHESYINEWCPFTSKFIKDPDSADGFISIPTAQLAGVVIKEFPTQASTVIHATGIAQGQRFSTLLKTSGEDVLYFAGIASNANRPCFNTETTVICGEGINMFFASFDWNHEKFMSIRRDQVICYSVIRRLPKLPDVAVSHASFMLKKNRCDFVFHFLRKTVRARGRMPKEVLDLVRFDPSIAIWFPGCLIRIVAGYRP